MVKNTPHLFYPPETIAVPHSTGGKVGPKAGINVGPKAGIYVGPKAGIYVSKKRNFFVLTRIRIPNRSTNGLVTTATERPLKSGRYRKPSVFIFTFG